MNAYIIPGIIKENNMVGYYLHQAGINLTILRQDTRKREIVELRQAVMMFTYICLKWNQTQSGLLFGLHHSTVNYTLNQMRGELDMFKKYPTMKISKRLEIYNRLVNIKNQNMKQTSITAFRESRSEAEKHRNIILDVLKKNNKPLSSMQISTKCYLSYYQISRRMSELENTGKVIDSKLKAVNPSGKKATMYQLPNSQLQLELIS